MKKTINRFYPVVILAVFAILLLTVLRSSIFGHVEDEKHIYFEIVFLLLLAVVGELAVVYLKQPSVMILMLLGILMSSSFLMISWEFLLSLHLPFTFPSGPPEILRLEKIIHVFAQLGAVILLFKVGLHNKIERIFAKDNMIVALSGVIVPFFVGYIYASVSGGNFAYSMFLGAAFTATSVGVTVALLKEFNLLKQRFAEIIIGAAVIDDVLGLLVLSFVINISGGQIALESLLFTGASALVFILGSITIGKYFVSYIDKKVLTPMTFLLVFCLILSYAYVAEFIKLSAIVGAFIAGIVLNPSKHLKEIEEKTYGLEILFMPIFFISLGILIDVNAIVQYLVPILVISFLALISKVIACSVSSLLAKLKPEEALQVGIGMAPRGEVALIVASIGLSTSILDASQYSIISAMALITTFVVPPILSFTLKKSE